MVLVLGPKDRKKVVALKAEGVPIINTTSTEKISWSRKLSPFFLGPVKLYGIYQSKNVENAWQFCKVYKDFVDEKGDPNFKYFIWAKNGWDSKRAFRYPMGKGAVPEYSYWDDKKLGYVDARKIIYVPLYIKAVACTDAFKKLQTENKVHDKIVLWDFDAYDHRELGMTYEQVLNDYTRKMGHAFVLAMLLECKDKILEMIHTGL